MNVRKSTMHQLFLPTVHGKSGLFSNLNNAQKTPFTGRENVLSTCEMMPLGLWKTERIRLGFLRKRHGEHDLLESRTCKVNRA